MTALFLSVETRTISPTNHIYEVGNGLGTWRRYFTTSGALTRPLPQLTTTTTPTSTLTTPPLSTPYLALPLEEPLNSYFIDYSHSQSLRLSLSHTHTYIHTNHVERITDVGLAGLARCVPFEAFFADHSAKKGRVANQLLFRFLAHSILLN